MLKIKDIKYGLVPTGPAIGVSALQVFFDEDDSEYQSDEYDTGKKWEINKETRMISENPRELFLDFLKKVEKHSMFETTINGKQSCFIVYMGGQIDNPKNFSEYNRFNIDLSNRAWNYQITIGLNVNQQKPPYSIFVGKPQYMTGKNQFYEGFNSIYPVLHLVEDQLEFNSLALQEIFNGPFSLATIFFENGNFDKMFEIKDKFKLSNHKILLIDVKSSKENPIDEVVKKFNFRYFPYLKGKNFLKLI
jgi:hypothetical protein